MNETKKMVEFSIRIPIELNEKIERDMVIAERKKNQQVNFIIKEFYEPQEKEQAADAVN